MIEKIWKDSDAINRESKAKKFDREAEKKYRQEVRGILAKSLSEVLGVLGFKKAGYSLWSREIGDSWHILYLQRSQWGHQYYIEAGICNKKDMSGDEKLDITRCKKRNRIADIVASIEKERSSGQENVEEAVRGKMNDINTALNFEAQDAREKYPGEYFIPSIGPQESKKKIEKIKRAVEEYIPLWFAAGVQG